MTKSASIDITQMMQLSKKLYAKHKDSWMPMTPESGIYWIAWLVGEVGEVIDIVKKKGAKEITKNPEVRKEMLLEIVDCYMYLADILNRYGYTPKDFSKAYLDKMEHNLKSGRGYWKKNPNKKIAKR